MAGSMYSTIAAISSMNCATLRANRSRSTVCGVYCWAAVATQVRIRCTSRPGRTPRPTACSGRSRPSRRRAGGKLTRASFGAGRALQERCPPPVSADPAGSRSADDFGSGTAAARAAIADELLDAFSGVHLGGIDIAVTVQADLMQPVEVAGHATRVAEAAELLKIAASQDVDGLVGIVADIEAALRFIGGEVHRYSRTWHDGQGIGVTADPALGHKSALARNTVWIAAGRAQ